MAADNNSDGEVQITTPIGSLSSKGKRTAEFIAILSLCLLFLLAYVLWEHKTDAKAIGIDLRDAIKEMTTAQHENTAAQRELNCLIAIPQEQREKQAEFCKRIAR